jgi:putative membrane protein
LKTYSIKLFLVSLLFFLSVLFSLSSEFPKQQLLQHLGTLLVSSILLFDLVVKRLSLPSFIGVFLFILLHIIGARWIYSFVPYESFFNAFEIDIHQLLKLNGQRNHYDRFVHFSFGVLMLPYVYEVFKHRIKNSLLCLLLAWLSIQTFSMIYEVFEWLLTVVISGEAATDYNGQQGDIWDAQKDMALAMLGSSLVAIVYLYRQLKKRK